MKILSPWKNNQDLDEIEKSLEQALVPVSARSEFLDQLKMRMQAYPSSPSIELAPSPSADKRKYTLIGLAGLFSALMIIAAGFRTAAMILGMMGIYSEINKQVKNKETPKLTPTS